MSFSALYEYMHGEFQDVTRVPLAAAGVDPAWIIDPNGVKIAGHTIELWDAATGGTQLLEGVDYSLVFLDSGKTAAEGIDIWAGYQVLNVAYQGIPLYITARIIGGYTLIQATALTADKTVIIPTGSDAATIQALIDAQPKILNGYDLTFQFQDGTYTLDTQLTFEFFIGGQLLIYGNGANTGPTGGKAVSLTSAVTDNIISLFANTKSTVKFMDIYTTASSNESIIRCDSTVTTLEHLYLNGSVSNLTAIRASRVSVWVNDIGIEGFFNGLLSMYGGTLSTGTANIFNGNTTDLVAERSSIIEHGLDIISEGLTYSVVSGGQIFDVTGHVAP